MSMYLKFRIGKDKRKLVPINGFELNDADSNNPQWIQGRQNEDGGRQVFVDLEDEDGSPVNLTGANAIFKGVLPGGEYKIWDHKHSTIIDAQAGRFRYTFPKRAMAIAGSYKQAFFEVYREGNKLATLEFNFEVLADLVEENIIPSDYITPFEDLYGKLKEYLVKFNGDFEAAMAQWKKDVADLITELNADVSGINLTITEIKTQLSALEDKIKADGLATIADLNALIDPLIERISQLENYNSAISIGTDVGGGIRDIFTNQIGNMRSRINPDIVNIGMLNDVHYTDRDTYWGPDSIAKTGITHILNLASVSDLLDYAVSVGDNTDDNADSSKFSEKRIMDYGTTWFTALECPSAILIGNHDDNSSHALVDGVTGDDFIVKDSYFAKAYRQNINLFGEKRNGDSNYFYYDIPDKNVRVIGIDDYENPHTFDDGKLKYPRIVNSIITDTQLNWLATDALQVPSDTHVAIFMHCPIDGTTTDNPTNICINHDVLKSLLEAYVSGTNGTLVGSNTDFPTSVKYSFASKGNLIGVFAGHVHYDDYKQVDGINYVANLNSVGSDMPRPGGKEYFNTNDEDSWAVIGIDTSKRHVKLIKFGRGTDMDFDY
ncbi:BppU family phage baseplate upper protein [Pediococcus acidilactici]|uniref:BppU family phage baseplate upper protein n=1 Tax=Pediococcus acidilactici TaxID=1254 RepID=UPI001912E8F8|nr:BppU family phage baseplate upper protein [Pediococcus acidilactici]QQP83936.1 BppU family phage baseplate upper protein [Pediococcus acidilactici]